MASRSYRPRSAYESTPLKRRVSGLGLAVGLELLVVLLLLGLGIRPVPVARSEGEPVVINVGPERQAEAEPREEKQQREEKKKQAETKPIIPPPPIVLPQMPVIPHTRPDKMIEISREEMAAGDLRNLPKAGRSAGDSEVVGHGPNGEQLFAAEWVREPSDAEMNGYLPREPRSGYGMVACKTASNNRVEDCIELENVPPGTRLASTLRQAAWQFRVRPPRKGGKPMIGAWVRIRFDFTVTGG